MSIAVKAIMMILVFMSVYSLGVSLERWWAFRVAKKQSVKFAIEIGPLLKQEKLKEAIDLAKKYKGSHIAKVVSPGLLEFAYEAHGGSAQANQLMTETMNLTVNRGNRLESAQTPVVFPTMAVVPQAKSTIASMGQLFCRRLPRCVICCPDQLIDPFDMVIFGHQQRNVVQIPFQSAPLAP